MSSNMSALHHYSIQPRYNMTYSLIHNTHSLLGYVLFSSKCDQILTFSALLALCGGWIPLTNLGYAENVTFVIVDLYVISGSFRSLNNRTRLYKPLNKSNWVVYFQDTFNEWDKKKPYYILMNSMNTLTLMPRVQWSDSAPVPAIDVWHPSCLL